MEQICFTEVAFSEQLVLDLLKPTFRHVLERNSVPVDNLVCKKCQKGSSVKCLYPLGVFTSQTQIEFSKHLDAVVFRINVLKTKSYFEIPDDLHKMVPEEYQAPVYSSTGGYMKLDFESTQEGALKYADYLYWVLDAKCRLLEAQIDAMPGDFSCCSRVEECSNARKCVNPFPDLAIGCGYRRKLKQGIIFYGVNQNA